MEIKTFEVGGMHCASCAKLVELSAKSLPGISSADVNVATGKLYIEYDGSASTEAALSEAVKKAGYSLQDTQKKN